MCLLVDIVIVLTTDRSVFKFQKFLELLFPNLSLARFPLAKQCRKKLPSESH